MTSSQKPGTPRRGVSRLWRLLIGAPRDLADPRVFHHVSLVVFLAWVGLGADGLSSSSYGPEEAYKALGPHAHLSILLIGMTTLTIAAISFAYSNVIQHFPGGGGGYLVATKLLGNHFGVVSGCALLVDYVLTITVSVASGCDQIWSFLPPAWHPYKFFVEFGVIGVLVILNLRGVKESVNILAPIFVVFIATHGFMIFYVLATHLGGLPSVIHGATVDFRSSVSAMGFVPVLLILLRAYSLGCGTYTGIEAVSNGITMFREPRVQTGKRTMILMAVSLAFTAGGILLGYLLTRSEPVPGRTMNAVLLTNLFGSWTVGGLAVGAGFVILCLIAEASLLFVAAQAGFLDGPRILSNMAQDSWVPHRFAQLSSRLVTKNGIVLMGLAACAALLYTRGDITTLVVMYSINVFLTFSLTELGMVRRCLGEGRGEPSWKRFLVLHFVGLVMCVSILGIVIYEKLLEGGWVTLVITGGVILVCHGVRAHYLHVKRNLQRLDDVLVGAPPPPGAECAAGTEALDRLAPTAVLCVSGFSGFGLHQVLSIHRSFPNYFKNFIFVSVSVVDSGAFKGAHEIEHLKTSTEENLRQYVAWARAHGLRADYRTATGTEAVSTAEEICRALAEEYPRAIFFMGKLIFQEERWYHRLFHNETASAIQRRLQFSGIQAMVLPIRVLES